MNALILLLYAPLLVVGVRLFLKRRRQSPPRFAYLSAAVVYLAVPWFFSSLGRYSLHWYPVLAAWVGVAISHICARTEQLWNSRLAVAITRIAVAAFCCTLIVVSPFNGSLQSYREQYAPVADLCRVGGSRERYLEVNLPGYLASKAVIQTLVSDRKKQTHVLVLLNEGLHFYFRKNANIISVGDYFGPARYRQLFDELGQSEDCPEYLSRLDISAVIISPVRPGVWWPRFYRQVQTRVTRCGYKQYRSDEDNMAIFLRSDIQPGAGLTPVTE